MDGSTLRRWLLILGSAGMLFQPAPGGCPNNEQILRVLANSTTSAIGGIVNLYVQPFVNQAFGV